MTTNRQHVLIRRRRGDPRASRPRAGQQPVSRRVGRPSRVWAVLYVALFLCALGVAFLYGGPATVGFFMIWSGALSLLTGQGFFVRLWVDSERVSMTARQARSAGVVMIVAGLIWTVWFEQAYPARDWRRMWQQFDTWSQYDEILKNPPRR
jgi:hypothetical protein